MTLLPSFVRSADDQPGRIPQPSLIAAAAALLPLVLIAAGLWWRPLLVTEGGLVMAAQGYAAALVAMLAGLHWSFARSPPPVLAAAAIAPFAILLPVVLGFHLLIAIFLLAALNHVTAAERGRVPDWFGSLATLIEAAAVVLLIAMLLRILM